MRENCHSDKLTQKEQTCHQNTFLDALNANPCISWRAGGLLKELKIKIVRMVTTSPIYITRTIFSARQHNIMTVYASRIYCGIMLSALYAIARPSIRYDTIELFNVDSKAEYSALSSTRSQKKRN